MVCGRRRRRDSPAARSRGGARPEKTELGLPGADSNGGWVGRHLRCMRKPLVAKSGHGDGWSVELDGGGGSARRGLAGASRPGFSRGYSIPNRAQKVREKVLRLTRGSWRPERPCRVDAGEDRRRSRGGARGWGRGSGFREPGRCGSTRRAPTKPVEWSERAERHQRQAIGAAEGSPAVQGSSAPTPKVRRRGLGCWVAA